MTSTHRATIPALFLMLTFLEAGAQTGPGSLVSVKPTRIDVKALPGRTNAIVVTSASGVVTITDSPDGAALLAPGSSGCSQAGASVSCPVPPTLRIKLGDGDDTLLNLTDIPTLAKGGSGDDTLIGGSSKDQLIGDTDDDTIFGGPGDDDLRGGTGNDVFEGGAGADRINGQGGLDVVSYRDPLTWPTVTRDRDPHDGESGEGDNVFPSIEEVDVYPFNYRADDVVLPRGGRLQLWDTWVADGPFDLATRPETGIQTIGYYDTNGYVRVAARRIGEATWVHTPPLPTIYVKQRDAHRAIRLAFDPDGRLHLASNHHGIGDIDPGDPVVVCCSPLQYFRTPNPITSPSDVLTLTQMGMRSPDFTNPIEAEDVVTYPEFFTAEDGRFFFTYRDGYSHGGDMYTNEFDRQTGTWGNPNGGDPWYSGVRGFTNPDTSGTYGNAFWDGDRFHLIRRNSWRKRYRCGGSAVDHRCGLFYVWTRDFNHFYDINGVEQTTPISPSDHPPSTLIDAASLGGVDAVDANFDANHHPIVVYAKFASTRIGTSGVTEGDLQVFVASWNGTTWQQRQFSSFDLWYPTATMDGQAAAEVPQINSVVGPIDEGGTTYWYIRSTRFVTPPVTTGWTRFNPTTLELTSAPAFSPPGPPCQNATSFLPVQHPDWVDPQTGARFHAVNSRSNARNIVQGLGGDAGDYFYISWDAVSPAPVTDPPSVQLSLRRTNCKRP